MLVPAGFRAGGDDDLQGGDLGMVARGVADGGAVGGGGGAVQQGAGDFGAIPFVGEGQGGGEGDKERQGGEAE